MEVLTSPLSLDDVAAQFDRYISTFKEEARELSGLHSQLAARDAGLVSRKHMRGHLTASALVLNEAMTHTLFIHHKASDFWMQPGGHYEDEASLWETAQREVAEETGVTALHLHPWHSAHNHPFDLHTHEIAARPDKNEGDHFHHDFLYLTIAAQSDLALQASEIEGARWIPLGELSALPGLRLKYRFLPKLRALGLTG